MRFLEETQANCERITPDTNINIEFQCTVNVDGTKNGFTLSTEAKDLSFEGQSDAKVTISSIANITKNHIELQKGNELKTTLVLNNTKLEQSEKAFTLIGNDNQILLSLNNNTNIVACPVKNLEEKLYKMECVPLFTVINIEKKAINYFLFLLCIISFKVKNDNHNNFYKLQVKKV